MRKRFITNQFNTDLENFSLSSNNFITFYIKYCSNKRVIIVQIFNIKNQDYLIKKQRIASQTF